MQLAAMRDVLEHSGPVATVYLESAAPAEDAAQQAHLRWRGLREELTGSGADDATLDAIEEALRPDPFGEIQADGRVLVAGDGSVLLDTPWGAEEGAGDQAFWSPAPRLEAYLRDELTGVRVLIVIGDQEGAEIRSEVISEQRAAVTGDHEVTGGSGGPVHKARGGDTTHKRSQRRAEETVKRNERDVAERIGAIADRFAPSAVIVAGSEQARAQLREELPDRLQSIYYDSHRGGNQDDGAEEALAEEVDEIAARLREDRIAANGEAFGKARHDGLVAVGARDVFEAGRYGAVATLLINRRASGMEDDASQPSRASAVAACSAGDARAAVADLDDYLAAEDGGGAEDSAVDNGADTAAGGPGPVLAALLRFNVPTG